MDYLDGSIPLHKPVKDHLLKPYYTASSRSVNVFALSAFTQDFKPVSLRCRIDYL